MIKPVSYIIYSLALCVRIIIHKHNTMLWVYFSNFTKPDSGPVFLQNVYCDGFESSVLQCGNSGWKSTPTSDYSDAVGVYCFEHGKNDITVDNKVKHSLLNTY